MQRFDTRVAKLEQTQGGAEPWRIIWLHGKPDGTTETEDDVRGQLGTARRVMFVRWMDSTDAVDSADGG